MIKKVLLRSLLVYGLRLLGIGIFILGIIFMFFPPHSHYWGVLTLLFGGFLIFLSSQ